MMKMPLGLLIWGLILLIIERVRCKICNRGGGDTNVL